MDSQSARQAPRFSKLPEPGLDEGLGLGIAVAAPPVRHATHGPEQTVGSHDPLDTLTVHRPCGKAQSVRIQMALVVRYWSRAWGPHSWPQPDILWPPKGTAGSKRL